MLADILKKDIRQYASRGIDFAPEDIVRLNALAVRVALVQRPCTGVHLPRCVFLPAVSRWGGELVLREPTIAHDCWLESAARWIDRSDLRSSLYLDAFALSRFDADALPDADNPRKVIRGVYGFAARRLVRYTVRQLRDAIDYVVSGADWTLGESAVPRPAKDGAEKYAAPGDDSPTLGLICRARAMRLPVSLADARRMTASELGEAICAAAISDGAFDAADARNSAMGDYVRTRNAIVARIEKENAARENGAST